MVGSTAKRRDADYVLDLFDEVIGSPGLREHRFDWLLGDAGKGGRRAPLPVDAFWPSHRLVVEIHERQHIDAVAHFDKPGRLTVSGVDRREQRRLYDARRRSEVPAHGLLLLILPTSELACSGSGRLLRREEADRCIVEKRLAEIGWGRVDMARPSATRSDVAGKNSLQGLADDLQSFASAREWGRFHTPKNLAMAVAGEAGELVSELQWLSDEEIRSGLAEGDLRGRIGSEMADVLLYLVRLADVCGVDLLEEAGVKMRLNERRYSVTSARGNARKYTELARGEEAP